MNYHLNPLFEHHYLQLISLNLFNFPSFFSVSPLRSTSPLKLLASNAEQFFIQKKNKLAVFQFRFHLQARILLYPKSLRKVSHLHY